MENATNDQKLSKFMQAITAYAEEQSRAMHREVEAFKEERLQRAEEEVLRESYALIQTEQNEIHRALSREMSLREMQARHALLGRRRDMMDSIFDRARRKLRDYAATPAYGEGLTRSMRRMTAMLPADGSVYAVAPRDEAYLPALRALCPAGSRVEMAADIELGGLRGLNAAAGVLLDDTLDSRLEQQRDWFTDHSGLTIE